MKNFLAPIKQNHIVNRLTTEVGRFYLNHESAILTGGTIGFSLATTAITIKNARGVIEALDRAQSRITACRTQEDKNQVYADAIKELAPLVAPIFIFQALTIGCALKAKKQSDKRIGELASALAIAQQAVTYYQGFQKDAEEALGKDKMNKIEKEVEAKTVHEVSRMPVNTKQSDDDQLIYEPVTGQIFWSTPDRIDKAWVIYKNNVRNSNDAFVSIADGGFLSNAGADDGCMAADLFGHFNEDAERMDDKVYLNTTKVVVNGKEMAALSINYYPTINFFGEITN